MMCLMPPYVHISLRGSRISWMQVVPLLQTTLSLSLFLSLSLSLSPLPSASPPLSPDSARPLWGPAGAGPARGPGFPGHAHDGGAAAPLQPPPPHQHAPHP